VRGGDGGSAAPADAAPKTPVPGRRHERRAWLRLPLALLLQLLLLLLLFLIWVLGTQSGLRFAVGVAQDLAPGLLQVEQVEGRLLGDVRLTGLELHSPGLELGIGDAVLRWAPLGALSGALPVQELRVRDLALTTQPAEGPAEEEGHEAETPSKLPGISLPFAVDIAQVQVDRLSIGRAGNGEAFVVERVALSATLEGDRLTLRQLRVELPQPRTQATVEGTLELSGDYPMDLALDWQLRGDPALELTGTGTVQGDLMRLRLDHSVTGSAAITLAGVVQGVLGSPAWEAELAIARVDLPTLAAELPAVDVRGRLTSSGDLREARVRGELAGEAPDLPDFGHLKVDLDLVWKDQVLDILSLELSEQKSGALLTADGELDLSEEVGTFDLRAAWEKLRWPLTGAVVAEARQGKLDAAGTFDAYRYRLQAVAWGPAFPELALRLDGEGDRQATRIEDLGLDLLGGRVSAVGEVSWAPRPAWDLVITADGIDTGGQWPEMPLQAVLELSSAGNLDGYEYRLVGRLDSGAIPPVDLSLAGTGDGRGTRVERLSIETLGGTVETQGEASWDPRVTWDIGVDVSRINPGAHWPEWAGELGGRLTSAGSLGDEGPELTALIEGLGGTLRGYPVSADGKLRMAGREVEIRQLKLSSGPSSLTAEGDVGERLGVRFDLQSPDLRTLLPEARGRVSASGTLSGSLEAPAVRLDLTAQGVEVAGQGIERLGGGADLDFAEGGNLRIDLAGERLVAGGMRFDSLKIAGDGALSAHRLSASVVGQPLALELGASGGLDAEKAYRGALERLTLRSNDFGTWRLQRRADIAYQGDALTAGPLCLREEGGSGGCVSFEQAGAGQWAANADIDKLAFDLIAAFVPEGLVIDGYAGAKAEFRVEGGLLKGGADLTVPVAVIRTDTEEVLEVVNLSSSSLGVDAGAGGLQGLLDIRFAGLGGIRGELALPGWRLAEPARPDQGLRGRLQGGVEDLSLISRFVPDVTDVTGRVDVDLGLSGSIARPGIRGQARLTGAGFRVPLIGLAVTDITLGAEAASAQRIDYSGGLTAGEGRLELTGRTLLGGAGPDTKLEARGERLRLADSREYFVLASPRIEVDAGPQGVVVGGEVKVPEARIRPRSIPAGAVSPSADVVVGTQLDEQPAYPLKLDLRLLLGENVTLDAFGLRARLVGDLRVLQVPGREPLGDGQLEVIDGTYRLAGGFGLTAAIGRPLSVDQGIITFAKTPLSNPGLVLTAKREGGDVTAGVRVFGTLKSPKLTFFSDSDPGLSQSEITNYLVTGIPPGGASGSENRGLSLGTYVAPKLFMEYESSLGDEQDKVKLRYDFNNWVEFQTETGDSQGADVFLKLER
jgi:translocation and assembly module TamB